MRAREVRRRGSPATWVALASLVAFVGLALVVNESGAVAFDDPVGAFVRGLPASTGAWTLITSAGGVVLVPIGIAFVLALLALRRPGTALIDGITLLAASAWTHVMKVEIARERPPGQALIVAPGFSFPSGHALNSTVTYGLIALLVWRSDWPAWVRRVAVAALVALPLLIGASRVALGVHYPSDVAGGWLAGLAIVATVATFTRADPAAAVEEPPDPARPFAS
jgi:undecaprenyl-diphosphatase